MTREHFITYPSYMCNAGKVALLKACIIAGIAKPRLVSEETAVIAHYSHNHLETLQQEDRIVAFVDIGNAKTTVLVA